MARDVRVCHACREDGKDFLKSRESGVLSRAYGRTQDSRLKDSRLLTCTLIQFLHRVNAALQEVAVVLCIGRVAYWIGQ
jgi:hypothetical protein